MIAPIPKHGPKAERAVADATRAPGRGLEAYRQGVLGAISAYMGSTPADADRKGHRKSVFRRATRERKAPPGSLFS